jgi:hypothetical protein
MPSVTVTIGDDPVTGSNQFVYPTPTAKRSGAAVAYC